MRYFYLLLVGLFLSGCHFVGDPQSTAGESGFWAGLWDGAVMLWAVVLTIFTDVQVLDMQNNGFLYKSGFAIGVFFLSYHVGFVFGLISLILYMLPF